MSDSLKRVRDEKKGVEQKVESVLGVIAQRTQWIEILNTIHTCVRDGMWMTSLQPVLNADGDAAQVEIKITGFDDKLKTAPGEPNAFEELRDKLRKSDVFTEKTEITAMPVPKSDAYSRECKLLAELKQAIKLGKQDKTQ